MHAHTGGAQHPRQAVAGARPGRRRGDVERPAARLPRFGGGRAARPRPPRGRMLRVRELGRHEGRRSRDPRAHRRGRSRDGRSVDVREPEEVERVAGEIPVGQHSPVGDHADACPAELFVEAIGVRSLVRREPEEPKLHAARVLDCRGHQRAADARAAPVRAHDEPPQLAAVAAVSGFGAVDLHGADELVAVPCHKEDALARRQPRRRVRVRRACAVARQRRLQAERHAARVRVEQQLRELVEARRDGSRVELLDRDRHSFQPRLAPMGGEAGERSFGLGLQGDKRPGDYAALARRAEADGFDVVSVFNDLFFQPALPPLLEIATATERVRIGPACLNPFTVHPVELAGQVAALDAASEGRAYLGLAAGAWLDRLGLDTRRALTAISETWEIVRRLLAGDDSGFEGRLFRLAAGSTLAYEPVRRSVPLLVGTWSPRLTAFAAAHAAELKNGGSSNPALVRLVREWLAGSSTRLVVGAVTVVDDDDARARAAARAEVALYLPV